MTSHGNDLAQFVTRRDELPAETFTWGDLKWLCNAGQSPGAAQTLGICHIRPGQGNPRHYHPNCEELLYVLSGCGEHSFNDQFIAARPGTTIRIPAGVVHNLRNTGPETLTCLISFSSGDRQTVFLE